MLNPNIDKTMFRVLITSGIALLSLAGFVKFATIIEIKYKLVTVIAEFGKGNEFWLTIVGLLLVGAALFLRYMLLKYKNSDTKQQLTKLILDIETDMLTDSFTNLQKHLILENRIKELKLLSGADIPYNKESTNICPKIVFQNIKNLLGN